MSILRSETGTVHICGHRGHLVASPENTFASFRMAKELGATICETDLVLSADGELILSMMPRSTAHRTAKAWCQR